MKDAYDPPARSSFAQMAMASLVNCGALVLLGTVLAYWTWAWLAPPPEPRAPTAAQAGAAAQSAFALFGSAARNGAATAPTGIAATLLGVVASTGGQPGYAVMRLDSKPAIAVREGEIIAPGVRLAEVHAGQVVLERSGVREILAWPKPRSVALPVGPRTNN